MDSQTIPKHIFLELTTLPEVCAFTALPTGRVKHVCLAASTRHFVLGSSAGSVYVFSRYFSSKRSSISNLPMHAIALASRLGVAAAVIAVSISADEKYLAAALDCSTVVLLNLSALDAAEQTVQLPPSAAVTALFWAECGLVVGCRNGAVYNVKPTSTLCEQLASLDSAVVQIDGAANKLLISTRTASYISRDGQGLQVIGRRKRNGRYGACFCSAEVAFCSRPGSRLWEVSTRDGSVFSTHQFSASTCPVRLDVANTQNDGRDLRQAVSAAGLEFGRVFHIDSQFLITLSGGDTLYVVDPQNSTVVLCSTVAETEDPIVEIAVCSNDIFLLTAQNAVRKLSFVSIEKAIRKLRSKQCTGHITHLLELQNTDVRATAEIYQECLAWLGRNGETERARRFEESCVPRESNGNYAPQVDKHHTSIQRLDSGIHKVVSNKGLDNSGYADDFQLNSTLLRRRKSHRSRVVEQYSDSDKSEAMPEDNKQLSTVDAQEFCVTCGLHTSWRRMAQLAPVLRAAGIVMNQQNVSGIPSTYEQWRSFLHQFTTSPSPKQHCDSCVKTVKLPCAASEAPQQINGTKLALPREFFILDRITLSKFSHTAVPVTNGSICSKSPQSSFTGQSHIQSVALGLPIDFVLYCMLFSLADINQSMDLMSEFYPHTPLPTELWVAAAEIAQASPRLSLSEDQCRVVATSMGISVRAVQSENQSIKSSVIDLSASCAICALHLRLPMENCPVFCYVSCSHTFHALCIENMTTQGCPVCTIRQ